MPQPESTQPPAQQFSARAMVRRALKAPLTYIGAAFVAYKPTIQLIYWLVDFYGNMQTVGELYTTFIKPAIGFFYKAIDFLNTGWGTVALMAAGFGLIALQLYLQQRRMHLAFKASPTEPPIEIGETEEVAEGGQKDAVPETRQIAGGEKPPAGELTPAYLTNFYKRFPPEQAKGYADVFIGFPMKLPVTVKEITRQADGKYSNVRFQTEDVWGDGSDKVPVSLNFNSESDNYLASLSVYERVTIRGEVKEVTAQGVALTNCEIITPTPAELAKRERLAPLDPTRPVYLTPEYLNGLFLKYANDPKAMNKETKAWVNRWVEITGVFINLSGGAHGMWVMNIREKYLPKDTQLFVTEDDNPHVSTFKIGDRMKVKGVVMIFNYDTLVLEDCFITWSS